MTDEEKKEELQKYLLAVDRLKARCEDAARWESMSLGPTGGARLRSGPQGPDEIKETAIQLRQECEKLAVNVRGCRQRMDTAFACMKDDRLRSLLEHKYIEGMPDGELYGDVMHCTKRHFYRLMTQALQELDRTSNFFSQKVVTKCHQMSP